MEEEEKNKFIDKSNDKKYFSIIPNFIVNHSTHWEKSLYLTLKRIAGEEGSCWTSPNILAKIEHCSPNKIRETLKSLEKREWIKKIGKKGKTKPTNEYIIVDLWDLNNKYYQEKESSPGAQSKRKFTRCTKKVHQVNKESSPGGNKEEHIKKNNKENNILITNSEFKKFAPPKRKEFKVSPEIYKEITDAYQKYKGIQLSGAEFGEVKRAIKTMLYSGRTKSNILDFMRFCKEVENEPDYIWLRNWSILTIKRKMPEFLAGKFQKVDEDEEWHLAK